MANGRSLQRIDAAEKRQKVVDARADGNTWAQCADLAGYANPESAIRAFDQAMKEKPHRNADQWRDEHIEYLQSAYARNVAIAKDPPKRTTATGHPAYDVDTCICPVKGSIKENHHDYCTAKQVVDVRAGIAADTEARHIGESIRKMMGLDLGVQSVPLDPATTKYQRELMDWAERLPPENQRLEAENQRLREELAKWESGLYGIAELA